MVKVRNVGPHAYTGPALQVGAGEEAEVTEAQATYLLSAECPGQFEEVKAPKPAAGAKR